MKDAFIHLFETSTGYYLFDVNTDSILDIPKDVYLFLQGKSDVINDKEVIQYMENLKNKGFLKSNRVLKTKHPSTDYLEFYLKNFISTLVLQVTQNCNLKCDYCIYSGGYINREHNNKRMNFEIAKKGIDFLLVNSQNAKDIHIGFYGGEPLLEFALIKECIGYALERNAGRSTYFNLTSNLTLLSEEMLEFFIQNDVTLMISLDGPAKVHDRSRCFAKTHKGTHKIVIEKIKMIKRKSRDYFRRHVLINTVLDQENSLFEVVRYFEKERLLRRVSITSSVINNNYAIQKKKATESYVIEEKCESFKIFLKKLGYLKDDEVSQLMKELEGQLGEARNGKHNFHKVQMPQVGHRGGPCIPGVHSLFLTADGDFFPCEKVSELSEVGNIGSLEVGFNIEKVKDILNIGKITENKCKNCWAYDYCSICLAQTDCEKKLEANFILSKCEQVRIRTENIFKDYCVLRDLGYDFEYNSH